MISVSFPKFTAKAQFVDLLQRFSVFKNDILLKVTLEDGSCVISCTKFKQEQGTVKHYEFSFQESSIKIKGIEPEKLTSFFVGIFSPSKLIQVLNHISDEFSLTINLQEGETLFEDVHHYSTNLVIQDSRTKFSLDSSAISNFYRDPSDASYKILKKDQFESVFNTQDAQYSFHLSKDDLVKVIDFCKIDEVSSLIKVNLSDDNSSVVIRDESDAFSLNFVPMSIDVESKDIMSMSKSIQLPLVTKESHNAYVFDKKIILIADKSSEKIILLKMETR